ncbi:hypothetical protein YPPY64_1895 [Yersinia pestis PY-64]|nr:hypothetical protein YPPY05_1814 [Yersinia pestis PY-05]EIR08003.1 hypothetical protein YPPY06_1878 [Yersinia pestis PY-06]EIR66589.1 hypothetical protein YPPY25_1868 [Yersinia pestis PY-25]EIR79304.1 hypothetical protein YPPY32_2112 [Yersinia pestis PY-32]EIS20230.1 hypothetical protein YPPY53_1886 [Yersinia pestis PY-53]EIS33357.1 hypothetical protein YPPY56_1893 [Yersinia pestis PY-56]EIS63871.1 hypothetical protein YPPY64_1895 [Yersinia pestis PY-64]EIS78110.1 hypothetical protein YPP
MLKKKATSSINDCLSLKYLHLRKFVSLYLRNQNGIGHQNTL